jgi:UDP-N-acetylmuramoyl-tripeptide--D-alanyl-D-alanine ligase
MEYMTGMTLEKITQAVGGNYTGPAEMLQKEVSSITIDSRQVQKDSLFVAIKGARVDGATFIPGAYKDGAICCMSTDAPKDEAKPHIQVSSCEEALKSMAEYYRSILDIIVVGITGSVGKTTTKEMIASVLSQRYDTLKTLGNFNNEIGLPLTVFRLREHHQVAVLEMGISNFGEMSRLAKVAKPDYCVITNIGQCHLENLGTREGILKAKTEMLDYRNPQGNVYVNGEDDMLATLVDDDRIADKSHLVSFGLAVDGDGSVAAESSQNTPCERTWQVYGDHVRTLGLQGSQVEIHTPQGSIDVTVPAPGRHMILNALAAAALGTGLGLSLEQIRDGIAAYEPVGGHGHIISAGDMTILDDCYNANPVSMKAGLDVLGEVATRKVAILGDMFELGEDEWNMHYEVGSYAAEKGIDVIIAIGTLAKAYRQGVLDFKEKSGFAGQMVYYPTRDEAMETLPGYLHPGDSVLVKASHGMHFENIVEVLTKTT